MLFSSLVGLWLHLLVVNEHEINLKPFIKINIGAQCTNLVGDIEFFMACSAKVGADHMEN